MKTGIELIAQERKEQVEKHGFDAKRDELYSKGELIKAAIFCLTQNDRNWYPKKWDDWFKVNIAHKMMRMEPIDFDIEMAKIAGAFLAAEIDRLSEIKEKDEPTEQQGIFRLR